ncbi:MAG: hypothetical protein IJV77_01230 [Clostridia bacterium]|nr:hypothetical protein [Clostridia bacterium]
MIAKIVANDREYYSYIFAKFDPGFYETVIVFDDENEKFEFLNVYDVKPSLKRKVFVIDADVDGMVEKEAIKLSWVKSFKNCFGFGWILDNIDLITRIKEGKTIDSKFIGLAKKINNRLNISEWNYVKNEKDAQDLLHAAWGFHDAVLDNISYKLKETFDDPSVVQVLFTGCWECDILLEFKRDVLIHFNVDDMNSHEIFDSTILFDDGYIYWVDDNIENVKEIQDDYIYFRARSLRWKMITKK